jgi:hypothetical protein
MENFIYTRSEKYLPRLFKLTSGDIFTTDYDLAAVVAAGRIAVLDAKAVLPNGKIGKSYRVIK